MDVKNQIKDNNITLSNVALDDKELKTLSVNDITCNNSIRKQKNPNYRFYNRPELIPHDAQFINHISYLSQVHYHSLI